MTHSCESGSHKASLLIIDDQRENVELLVRILKDAGFTRITASTDSGRLAELHFQCHPDIVLLDLHMPGQDGFDVLRRLAPFIMGDDRLPVIMITGDDSTDVKRKALSLGARDFISKPFDQAEVVIRIKNLLETRLLHQRLMQQKDDLEKTVAVRTRQFEESQVEMLERLATTVDFRDDGTGAHTKRVGAASAQLAQMVGLSSAVADLIERAAPLHDIGKVAIPDTILRKPCALTPEERSTMQSHTTIGAAMLSRGHSELVRLAERIARSHHERWDGSGYPDRLSGQSIPLEARIVAVADFLDALTHNRPYRTAWTVKETVDAISAGSGSHFEPAIVRALMQIDEDRGAASLVA